MAHVHLSSGVFWFWDGPWWTHMERLASSAVSGIQILCAPVNDELPLPPVRVARRLAERFALTLHPTFGPGGFHHTAECLSAFRELRQWIEATSVRDVILHVDHFPRGEADLKELRGGLPGINLMIENVGAGSERGTTPADLRQLLDCDSDLRFILDVAHWFEIAGGEPTLRAWLDDPVLMKRLAALHVSTSGIHDGVARAACRRFERLQTASHLPAVANPSYPDAAARKILSQVPLIAEGCLPDGEDGLQWILREVDYLSNWGTACLES